MCQRDADARVEEQRAAVDLRSARGSRRRCRPRSASQTGALGRGDHDRELVGAQAQRQVRRRRRPAAAWPTSRSTWSPLQVPVGVVDRLELVEVDQHHRALFAGGGGPSRAVEQCAAWEPRQRVDRVALEGGAARIGSRDRASDLHRASPSSMTKWVSWCALLPAISCYLPRHQRLYTCAAAGFDE